MDDTDADAAPRKDSKSRDRKGIAPDSGSEKYTAGAKGKRGGKGRRGGEGKGGASVEAKGGVGALLQQCADDLLAHVATFMPQK